MGILWRGPWGVLKGISRQPRHSGASIAMVTANVPGDGRVHEGDDTLALFCSESGCPYFTPACCSARGEEIRHVPHTLAQGTPVPGFRP